MKAVFFRHTDIYLPKPVVRALREADALARAGWDVSFVSWIKDATLPASSAPGLYPVKRVVHPVPALGTSFLRRASTYRRVTAELSQAGLEEHPDLVVAHDLEALSAAARTARTAGVPLVYDSHEDWPALIAENSRLESLVASFQERRLVRRAAHVFTVSEPIADRFRRMGKPTSVLYNARPSSEIHPADRDASRKGFGYRADDFVVGFAGALAQGRGLEELLEALLRLPPAVKVLIVGGPDDEAALLRNRAMSLGLGDRVRVDDYRAFSALAPYYAAMDLGAILLDPRPNHLQALPNKLFDYMAHGVAVLVPDYPAMGPIVRAGPCGWTLAHVRPEAIAEAVEEARRSDEGTLRGARGREAYRATYAWDNQDAKFLSVIRSLASRSRP